MPRGGGPDVAVIGAGICGTSVAALLAGRGATVRLYEREAIAAGASGRNSGVVQRPLDPALLPLYDATLTVYRDLAVEAPDAGFVLADEPAGLLLVAPAADGTDRLEALADRIGDAAPSLAPAVLQGSALRAEEPALADGVAAIRLPIGFPVTPSAPTYAMATLAERYGAAVRMGRSIRLAVHAGRAVGVEIDGRLEPADVVVVAAGPWTSELIDPMGRWRPIRALWGVVVETTLVDPPRHVLEAANLDVVIEQDPSASSDDVDRGHHRVESDFSLVPVGDVCSVGSTFLFEEPDLEGWRDRILARAIGYVPALYEAPIREVRSCARPLAADGRPLVGAIDSIPGLFVCAGHGPWGITTGPGSAALLVDQVLGGSGSIDPVFDPARFGQPGQASVSW
jgi:glycine/D-amino acid oxidase-like deaminating enzyme